MPSSNGEGLTYAQYREEVRREILMNEVRRSQVRRRINISEQEVKQVVEAPSRVSNTEYHVGHIQVALPDNPECRAAPTPPRPRSSASWPR